MAHCRRTSNVLLTWVIVDDDSHCESQFSMDHGILS